VAITITQASLKNHYSAIYKGVLVTDSTRNLLNLISKNWILISDGAPDIRRNYLGLLPVWQQI